MTAMAVAQVHGSSSLALNAHTTLAVNRATSFGSKKGVLLPSLAELRGERRLSGRESLIVRTLVVRAEDDDGFEERLAKLKRGTGSGQGKKAEARKARKEGLDNISKASARETVMLPPVPLKEPLSQGVPIEFGFTPYAERIHGSLAILGLGALLAVELGSGLSIGDYHGSSVIATQVYFILALSAIFIKIEREKISVWPDK